MLGRLWEASYDIHDSTLHVPGSRCWKGLLRPNVEAGKRFLQTVKRITEAEGQERAAYIYEMMIE